MFLLITKNSRSLKGDISAIITGASAISPMGSSPTPYVSFRRNSPYLAPAATLLDLLSLAIPTIHSNIPSVWYGKLNCFWSSLRGLFVSNIFGLIHYSFLSVIYNYCVMSYNVNNNIYLHCANITTIVQMRTYVPVSLAQPHPSHEKEGSGSISINDLFCWNFRNFIITKLSI